MMRRALVPALALVATGTCFAAQQASADLAGEYPFATRAGLRESMVDRFVTPQGYRRIEVEKGSFAEWLRGLPMRPKGCGVSAYDGAEVLPAGSPDLAGVVDLDGPRPVVRRRKLRAKGLLVAHQDDTVFVLQQRPGIQGALHDRSRGVISPHGVDADTHYFSFFISRLKPRRT